MINESKAGDKQYLTVSEASRFTGRSSITFYRLIAKLKARIGKDKDKDKPLLKNPMTKQYVLSKDYIIKRFKLSAIMPEDSLNHLINVLISEQKKTNELLGALLHKRATPALPPARAKQGFFKGIAGLLKGKRG
jgi:hypothetical protein